MRLQQIYFIKNECTKKVQFKIGKISKSVVEKRHTKQSQK